MKSDQKICLSIAGVDPSGGAGIIADIKTFTAFGCYGAAAITSLTFQNTVGVFGAINQSSVAVREQVVPVVEDLGVDALKTGMLPTADVIGEVARIIAAYNLMAFVCDPVVRSTSGYDLIDNAALRCLTEQLFPLAAVVTPNIPEAERITGMSISNDGDIRTAARQMQSMGALNVLIKGGHATTASGDGGKPPKARDYLFSGGAEFLFESDFVETTATHGTGCTLAAAITAGLALGNDLTDAVERAKRFVTAAIRTAPMIGHGHSPVNHLVKDF